MSDDPKILVIDDEEVVHASLRKVLRRKGFEPEMVFSAQEGLELLAARPFDLVITDLMMPEMNGIELLQELKRREIQVPIVMITGYPTIKTAVQAMRLGARDYLSKPFTRKELLGPVLRALRQNGPEEPGPDDDEPVDANALLPGAVVYLPHHAWARFEQDGIFQIGVEASFLGAVGAIASVAGPGQNAMLDQGTVEIRLTNSEGEEHGVAMPLSGQVVAINGEALAAPEQITAETWLVRILPSYLDAEIKNLASR
jgi:CheY-like chemotaxis protein/glycine cleavage system H lipoate-binding protein